jgi:hypothetical protein
MDRVEFWQGSKYVGSFAFWIGFIGCRRRSYAQEHQGETEDRCDVPHHGPVPCLGRPSCPRNGSSKRSVLSPEATLLSSM